ncbi:hypothetical protein F2Q68_00022237 [Brassica cretica]|uniref:Uncharacterized protein n=2 Tax=Brassica cretica TaxID=69181 RepID=A0A3N6RUS0_BRACR|nr:hypothetical protein F2Q68_00022237 [Brassica cretica]KAF3568522.1 hypothetical protein DY000_02018241 [Brassica cretica]
MSLEEMMEFDCSKDFVVFPNLQRVSLLANNIVPPLRLFIRRIMEQYLICIINAVINPHSQSVSISRSTEILGFTNHLDDDETAETVEQDDNDDETAAIEEMEKPFVFSDQPTR